MLIRVNNFAGIRPKLDAKVLPDNAAQVALNANLERGNLGPFESPLQVASLPKTGPIKSLHLMDDQYWLHWADVVNTIRGPIAGDTEERTYFTGDGANPPQITTIIKATAGGGTSFPYVSYDLGLPAPANALTSVDTADGADADTETVSYVYTYVTEWGEEGPPSPPSSPLDSLLDSTRNLSMIATVPAGNYNVTGMTKRLYRINVGATGAVYQLVAEIPVATDVYVDTTLSANLSISLISTEWIAPPEDMKGLTLMPNGVAIGYSGKEVCMCYPWQIHAWPLAYRQTVDSPIVGIGTFGNAALILTEGRPYSLMGSHPESMFMDKIESGESCLSAQGIVDAGGATVFPSPDGLQMYGTGVNKNVTDGILLPKDWEGYYPETLVGAASGLYYYGFYYTGAAWLGFRANMMTGEFIDLGIEACCVWKDPKSGNVYIVDTDNNLKEFDGDTGGPITYQWKSKLFQLARPANFGVGQVKSSGYPVTFKVHSTTDDGIHTDTIAVINNKPFRLSAGFLADEVEIEVLGTAEVTEIVIAETLAELKRV